jgi:hypothetical protein
MQAAVVFSGDPPDRRGPALNRSSHFSLAKAEGNRDPDKLCQVSFCKPLHPNQFQAKTPRIDRLE